MSKAKPIETHYNGYRFRSRTEARWAVCFDSIGVPYEYEKEGYELNAGRYLPDFWLPKQKCFFEVKGKRSTKEEKQKAIDLLEATTFPVVIAEGPPRFEPVKRGNMVCLGQHGRAFFVGRTLDSEKVKNHKEQEGWFTDGFFATDKPDDIWLKSLCVCACGDKEAGTVVYDAEIIAIVVNKNLCFMIDGSDSIIPYRHICPQKINDYFFTNNGQRALLSKDLKDESGLCSVAVLSSCGEIKQLPQGMPFIYGISGATFVANNIVEVISETEEFMNKGKSARFEFGEKG